MCNTVQFGESLDVGLCGYQGKKIEISRVRENEDGVKLQTFKTTTLQMLEPSRKKNETKTTMLLFWWSSSGTKQYKTKKQI